MLMCFTFTTEQEHSSQDRQSNLGNPCLGLFPPGSYFHSPDLPASLHHLYSAFLTMLVVPVD